MFSLPFRVLYFSLLNLQKFCFTVPDLLFLISLYLRLHSFFCVDDREFRRMLQINFHEIVWVRSCSQCWPWCLCSRLALWILRDWRNFWKDMTTSMILSCPSFTMGPIILVLARLVTYLHSNDIDTLTFNLLVLRNVRFNSNHLRYRYIAGTLLSCTCWTLFNLSHSVARRKIWSCRSDVFWYWIDLEWQSGGHEWCQRTG